MNKRRRKARREHTSRGRKLGFLGVRRIGKRVLDSRKAKRDVSETGK